MQVDCNTPHIQVQDLVPLIQKQSLSHARLGLIFIGILLCAHKFRDSVNPIGDSFKAAKSSGMSAVLISDRKDWLAKRWQNKKVPA